MTLAAHGVGQVAQLVEQWTENPRVGGSSPPLTTFLRVANGGDPFLPMENRVSPDDSMGQAARQ